MVRHKTLTLAFAGSNPATPAIYPGIAQFGRARDLGSRGRRFKPCCSDHAVYTEIMERYRSGHTGAVLKTVCRKTRGFESPSLRHAGLYEAKSSTLNNQKDKCAGGIT